MTRQQALALALIPALPRVGLTERLQVDDPVLLEWADAFAPQLPAILDSTIRVGASAVPWMDPEFPQVLLTLPDCPPAIWVRGTLDALRAPCVAIVGSRAATAAAREIASALAADLAARGITVVSGLARGVDSAAHRGALACGRTTAVLGSGIDRIYPAEHAGLMEDIARTGLILSEYPPGTPPLPFHFPQRNRLISGVSRAVVVIEAAEGSGSLITAACALEQGRDVMVVPGNVLTGRNRGGHALLRDGAKIVECADDIVSELGLAPPARRPGATDGHAGAATDPVAAVMEIGETYDLDALTGALGLSGPVLLARLLELELQGVVQRVGGGRFIRPGRTC